MRCTHLSNRTLVDKSLFIAQAVINCHNVNWRQISTRVMFWFESTRNNHFIDHHLRSPIILVNKTTNIREIILLILHVHPSPVKCNPIYARCDWSTECNALFSNYRYKKIMGCYYLSLYWFQSRTNETTIVAGAWMSNCIAKNTTNVFTFYAVIKKSKELY